MSTNFLKPFVPRPGILDPKPGDPLGFVTNDGMWAAIPCGKKFMIIRRSKKTYRVLNNSGDNFENGTPCNGLFPMSKTKMF